MPPLLQFVQSTTYDLTPTGNRLPPFLWTVFTALNKVHGLWRWYRRLELYRNPDNLIQLLAGHVVNIVMGETLLLRIAAQCLLISTRLLECTQQQASLYRSGKKWINDLKGSYPKLIKIKWEKKQKLAWISPSTKLWYRATSSTLLQRVEITAFNTFKIVKKSFKLSMKIMDVIDAFYWSPSTRNEGVVESFVNITKWLNAIVDNKEDLLRGITENQKIIERILTNTYLNYSQLHQAVTRTLENVESAYHQVKKISSFGGGILTELGKQLVSGGMVVMGLADYRPVSLAPSSTLTIS